MKKSIVCLLVVCAVVFSTSVCFALPIVSATEQLRDPEPFDIAARDLSRTRFNSEGYNVVENNDAVIVAENLIDPDFGIINTGDVSYRHDLTWLDPAADQFLDAVLTIYAWGNIGGNDVVFADSLNLGSLNNGTLGSFFFSSSQFGNSNPVILDAIFADGYLDIIIDKNRNAFLGALNAFSVYGSDLTVRYDAVPEPATMLLFGLGLAGFGFARREKKA